MNNLITSISITLLLSLATAETINSDMLNQLYSSSMSRIHTINDINYSQTSEAAAIMFEADFGRPPVSTEELISSGYLKPKNEIEDGSNG